MSYFTSSHSSVSRIPVQLSSAHTITRHCRCLFCFICLQPGHLENAPFYCLHLKYVLRVLVT